MVAVGAVEAEILAVPLLLLAKMPTNPLPRNERPRRRLVRLHQRMILRRAQKTLAMRIGGVGMKARRKRKKRPMRKKRPRD